MIRRNTDKSEKHQRCFKERKKGMALSQIIILILGTIAIACALGKGMEEVSAESLCENYGGTCKSREQCLAVSQSTIQSADCSSPLECCIPPAAASPAPQTKKDTSSIPTLIPTFASLLKLGGGAAPTAGASGAAATAGAAAKQDIILPGIRALFKGNVKIPGLSTAAVNVLSTVGAGLVQIGVNAGIAYALYQLSSWGLTALFPSLDVGLIDAISKGLGIGYGIGSSIATILAVAVKLGADLGALGTFAAGPLGTVIFGAIGAGIGFLAALLFYKKEMQEVFVFNCYSWMPAMGSAAICRQCGNNGLPCSKYECQSLGQGCKYLNEGTELATCDYVGANDADPPEITPWDNALLENYAYNPTTAISPPDKGVQITNTESEDGCTSYYTPIRFGVTLDKPAQCKYSLDKRETSYANMPDLFFPSSNGLSTYNHSITLSIPDLTGEEGTVPVSESGEHELFVRCKSENQVANSENFVFKFCISQQPDSSAPEIILTNPLNGFPITSGITSTNADVYLLEPSQCKWSYTKGQAYDTMSKTMTCTTIADANMLYKCSGTLDGLTNNVNKFYFKCKDTSPLQNVMTADYEYTLLGTQHLVIDSVGPTGIQKGSSNAVQVTLEARTSSGYDQGAANCYYNRRCWSNTGSATSYTPFQYPAGTSIYSAYSHSQDLYISAGTYTCSIKCEDLGGNTDIETTTYTVETDQNAPGVARAYNEDNLLKLVTNEKAECVYDLFNCNYNFGDGTAMTDSEDGLSHTTSWNTRNNLYVKCKDDYDNQPASGTCSIVVRATSVI